ncbi:MAG: acetate kinase [Clostridia bacterium]|nr:acetate kinase [Clostridia bacterium]
MKILVLNAGSSSLKYQLIDTDNGTVIAKGLCERIGLDNPKLVYGAAGKDKIEKILDMKDHTAAIQYVLDILSDKEVGVVSSMSEIDAVGHRIVHGGEKFNKSVLITEEVLKDIEEISDLAPLHNPANLMGVRACQAIMPATPMVAVFDTAFHQTMPPKAFLYGLPYEAYEKLMVRRYGFHGTSHYYVSERASELLGENGKDAKIITCHLGNGSSITAVAGGKSVDTSMGLTPLEGVVMGTRSGDMDPAIVTYLMEKLDLDIKGINEYLNKKSGVAGVSGVSSDFRDLSKAAAECNERAKIALDMFAYRVKKYVGAYAAAMGGVDAIVFTAGVGENDDAVRAAVLEGLEYMGVEADFELNANCPRGKEVEISKSSSKVKVFVIPTDEEMVIARQTAELV